jgi:hypothetical protein
MQYTTTGANTSGRLLLNQNTTGGGGNPILTLNQTNTAPGACSLRMFKNSNVAGTGIGEITFQANDAGGVQREYGRINATIRNTGSGNQDGSISMQALVNNGLIEFVRINGVDNQIEVFQPIDLNNAGATGGSIVTSTGDININASGSGGTGNVNITPKSGASCTFSTQLTLPATLVAATFTAPTLVCNFGNLSTGIFTASLTANMTAINFSAGRIGGQYTIYINNTSGGPILISNILTGPTNKTNYTAAVSLQPTTVALMTVTFYGSNYLIACSAYN